jgi:hypothetical protein
VNRRACGVREIRPGFHPVTGFAYCFFSSAT